MSDANQDEVRGRTDPGLAQIQGHADPDKETAKRLTEELDRLISNATEDNFDEQQFHTLLNELDKVAPFPDESEAFDVQKSLQGFRQKLDALESHDEGKSSADTSSISFPVRTRRRRLYRLAIIAAVLILLVLTAAYAISFGNRSEQLEITPDTIQYVPEDLQSAKITKIPLEIDEEFHFDSVQDMETAFGINTPLLPTWAPERFGMPEIYATRTDEYVGLYVSYVSGTDRLIIRVTELSQRISPPVTERNNPSIQALPLNGISYNFSSDEDVEKVTWRTNWFDGRISGSASREEMLQIVNSIYER